MGRATHTNASHGSEPVAGDSVGNREAVYVLPYPPTVNHYYTIARGRKILSPRGRAYRTRCVASIRLQRQRETLVGLVLVRAVFVPPDRRTRDVDNVTKPLLDAMKHGGVYGDDAQAKRVQLVMAEPDKRHPRVVVELYAVEPYHETRGARTDER